MLTEGILLCKHIFTDLKEIFVLKREIPKTIEEDGACGCVQVAGVGFNGPMFPQIDLGRIGRRKGRRVRDWV